MIQEGEGKASTTPAAAAAMSSSSTKAEEVIEGVQKDENEDQQIPFTKPISWDEYTKCRPPYPASLFRLWSEYHTGPLTTLHDVGAGGGVATHGLATHLSSSSNNNNTPLKRIYVSDPGATHLSFASKMLPPSHPDISFSFHECAAEELESEEEKGGVPIPPGSLDFVSCCEALHWADVEVALPIFHRSLRRGGTFAAVYYLPYPEITNSERLTEAQTELLDSFAKGVPEEMVKHPRWRLGLSQSNCGLDFVGFEGGTDEEWEGVRRVEINTTGGFTGGKLRKSRAVVERFGEAVERLSEDEKKKGKERWEDDGWKRKGVEVGELRELIQTSIGAGPEIWESEAGRNFVRAAEGVEGGKLDLCFQVAVVMARKK